MRFFQKIQICLIHNIYMNFDKKIFKKIRVLILPGIKIIPPYEMKMTKNLKKKDF